MKILLAVTFVFGVIKLLTHTKIFDKILDTPLVSVFYLKNKDYSAWKGLLLFFDNAFFYFSLVFQAWYWLFNK